MSNVLLTIIIASIQIMKIKNRVCMTICYMNVYCQIDIIRQLTKKRAVE